MLGVRCTILVRHAHNSLVYNLGVSRPLRSWLLVNEEDALRATQTFVGYTSEWLRNKTLFDFGLQTNNVRFLDSRAEGECPHIITEPTD